MSGIFRAPLALGRGVEWSGPADLDIEIADAPPQCGLVRVEEQIQALARDDASPILDEDGPAIVVTRHDHLRAERVLLVRGDKGVARGQIKVSGMNGGSFSGF